MPTLLHVGCGHLRKAHTTAGFNRPEWTEIRLDIDPAVAPDIVGSITDMAAIADATVDGLFSSHNIEHLYPFEAPLALAEFHRVLSPDGFAVITCPDLQSVAAEVAADRLLEPLGQSPLGPISPLDILYGHRPALARGELFMAHRCGFTRRVLTLVLQQAGFASVSAMQRRRPYFDLWAIASKREREAAEMNDLVMAHFPQP
jgi:SAM-dependent methyltransferase